MKKLKLRFFLDYGTCFWGGDDQNEFPGGLMPEDLPLSPETQLQVRQFLSEYDQHYDWGCPPSVGWTENACKRFNREYKRILSLVSPELSGQFFICNEQLDLIEERELLAEFYRRGHDFIEERKVNYYLYKN